MDEFEQRTNLGDILNELLEEKKLEQSQINPIVSALLLDKYGYHRRSYNLKQSFSAFDQIVDECSKWTAVDMMVAYQHPELGVAIINPKSELHWKSLELIKNNELLVLFAGAFQETDDDELFDLALEKLIDILEGRQVKTPASLTKPGGKPAAAVKAEAEVEAAASAAKPAQAPKAAKRRMTPQYSIPVTNELFHNGNVEAWKRIILSYETKYPESEVHVFYDGEKIHDINSLFKWGKVKHGSAILISVSGEEIKDVAKVRRYLNQGASPMFEAFLKFPVGQVLNLF